ncbi:MAG: hypothetical protein K8F91_22455, partial [Candidatus Obscuribacterales bacterium]|nr:hypothetical protein [Candidatus Obscuribacterales bacterium]
DATRMYIHAQGRYVENPMDESPGRARALWFLAEAHYRHCNFDIAASVFERAVKMYCATIGLTSPEARACLEDYLEFARGLKRDRRLTREVEDIIEFADWVADLDQAMDENGEVALSC